MMSLSRFANLGALASIQYRETIYLVRLVMDRTAV
jgi:hypothetical protein